MEKEGNNLFQVNLKGMIALLSEHIYSNPNTFVRELLQNCVDAITALRNIDENYKGRIDVFLNEDKTVVFRDNGIGLKEEEVYRFLTVIGESSKRDTPDADDFIGRFGIGLLSCFVVTNEITVESRSAMGGQPVCWCGKVDGTYQLTLSDEERPIGDDCNLLPSWAFFIRCLVNADGLLSTASRESLVSNDQLKDARKEIGVAIKDYLRGLVQNDRAMFNRILDVHHFHIKAIASEDNELLRLFMDYLPFETNKGLRSFGSIRSASNVICYTKNLEDFRQVRRIAGAQGWLVVNAAYTFDETLLKKYVRLNPELTLDEISPSRLLEQFGEVEANQEFQAFEVKANELLKRFGCICRLKHFTPVDIPVIFVAEEKENAAKSANNPLAAVLGAVNTTKQIPPTLTFNADNEMVQTLLQIQGDNKLFQHVVHILYVQSLLQGKYPVNSEEMELFNHSLSELMTSKMNDFINFLN